MAIFRRNRDSENRFKSPTTENVEIIRAQLDAARDKQAELENPDLARQAALSDDHAAAVQSLNDRITAQRGIVKTLERALGSAEQAERARLAGDADRKEKARQHDIARQVAALVNEAVDHRHALAEVHRTREALLRRVVEKYEPMLRPDERHVMFGHTSVESTLLTLLSLEQLRQSPDIACTTASLPSQGLRGVAPLRPHGMHWSEVDPIETQIERRFSLVPAALPRSVPVLPETIGKSPAPTGAEDFVPDDIDREMERVRRLAAGEEPAPTDDADDIQRQLAVEAVEAATSTEENP